MTTTPQNIEILRSAESVLREIVKDWMVEHEQFPTLHQFNVEREALRVEELAHQLGSLALYLAAPAEIKKERNQ